MGPYISRTPIRSQRGLSDHVGVPTSFRRNTDLARRDLLDVDGRLDCPVSIHNRCSDPLGTSRRPQAPSGAPSGSDGPPADRRRHRPLIFIGGSRFGRPAAPIGAARATCISPRVYFGPTLALTLGRLWADFRYNFGPTLGQSWVDLGPTLADFRSDFGPTWGRLWADFGPTSG